jgi:uncharacterized membrane protein (DUF4010 family)
MTRFVLVNAIPVDFFEIVLVLFLAFLVGLQREERKRSGQMIFGGVRTYPLIGLFGYSLAFLANPNRPIPTQQSNGVLIQPQSFPAQAFLLFAIGLLLVGGLMGLSYWRKIRQREDVGVTSEMVGLLTYVIGAIVYAQAYWLAATLVVLSLLLLELKSALESLTRRFSAQDILTFTQFLLLTVVILPVLPNQAYGTFSLNPFKTWLIVVAVSSISYGSFLLQRQLKGQGGLLLVAVLGGLYSSTVTTVALAKQSVTTSIPERYVAGILMASGMMYVRLALLVQLFNPRLGELLHRPLLLSSAIALLMGLGWWRRSSKVTSKTTVDTSQYPTNRNPLELQTAFVFASVFVGITILTHYTAQYFGVQGLYGLAAVMGVADVDPFILGLTQAAEPATAVVPAAIAVLIAAASNQVAKGVYAIVFGNPQVGRRSFIWLTSLAIVGILPVVWMAAQ